MKRRYVVEKRVRDEDSYFQSERNLLFEVREKGTGEIVHIFTGSTTDSSAGTVNDGTRAVSLLDDGQTLQVDDFDGTSRTISLP